MPLALQSYQKEQLMVRDSLASFQNKLLLGKSLYRVDFDIYNRNFLDTSSDFIKVSAKKEPVFVQVPTFLIEEIQQSVWSNFHSLNNRLRIAVLEKGLGKIIDALEGLLGEISIESITLVKPESYDSIEFFLSNSGKRYRCFLHMGKNGFAMVQSLFHKEYSGSFIPPIYVNLSAVIGRVGISLNELNQLQSGDLIFFDCMKDEEKVLLSVGKFYWMGILKEGGKIMVTEDEFKPIVPDPGRKKVEKRTDSTPPVEPNIPKPAGRKKSREHPTDKISLELTFEIGRTLVKLEELKDVKKGYLFDFPHMKEPKVDICVNEQKVGDGELVKIDGSMAVRVMNLEE